MATRKNPAPKNPTAPRRRNGRPKGSKDIQRDEVDVIGSRCKKCGSSLRTPYANDPTRMAYPGVDPITGKPYTQIVWRRTQCRDCGQHRIDKCYENLPKKRSQQS
ncbi:hypothetical protein [Aureliella helgolandensis]|uniref:Uncharacterized protein n=1 Tax=Aureliella helgolandensis TaxID=2527968 RepID=A0A518GEF3_9BACT|nr:hypothetical protein [Aureliella helgolandensis]QDV26928.1 hypothetical protein Q31a_53080 [Aureliella helgolandensis]